MNVTNECGTVVTDTLNKLDIMINDSDYGTMGSFGSPDELHGMLSNKLYVYYNFNFLEEYMRKIEFTSKSTYGCVGSSLSLYYMKDEEEFDSWFSKVKPEQKSKINVTR